MTLQGKKAVLLGERDDIPGQSLRTCVEAAGAEVVYETTSCVVWTTAGAAGLAEQEEIKRLVEEHGAENLVIVFGVNRPHILRIMTTTFRRGDPSYAGALAGVALELGCYHVLELKDEIPEDVWERELAFVELEIGEDERANILRAMEEARAA